MKAKIRGHNLPTQRQSDLEKAARQFIDDYIDDYIKKLQYKLSRRVTFALCLILSDQHGFGQKRCQRAVEGIGEILNGVAEDVYDRNEIDPEGRIDGPWYLYHHTGRSGVRREKEKARIRWNGYEPREMKSTISIANNT